MKCVEFKTLLIIITNPKFLQKVISTELSWEMRRFYNGIISKDAKIIVKSEILLCILWI